MDAHHLEDFRERFLHGAIYGGEQGFEQELAEHLATASHDVRWFACELIAVYFLFARIAINGPPGEPETA